MFEEKNRYSSDVFGISHYVKPVSIQRLKKLIIIIKKGHQQRFTYRSLFKFVYFFRYFKITCQCTQQFSISGSVQVLGKLVLVVKVLAGHNALCCGFSHQMERVSESNPYNPLGVHQTSPASGCFRENPPSAHSLTWLFCSSVKNLENSAVFPFHSDMLLKVVSGTISGCWYTRLSLSWNQ